MSGLSHRPAYGEVQHPHSVPVGLSEQALQAHALEEEEHRSELRSREIEAAQRSDQEAAQYLQQYGSRQQGELYLISPSSFPGRWAPASRSSNVDAPASGAEMMPTTSPGNR